MVFAARADAHRVTRIYARVATAAALSLGLAGCGLSHGAPAAPAPLPHPSAKRIYAEMQHSLGRFHSLEMQMTEVEQIGRHRVHAHVTSRIELPGRFEMVTSFGGRSYTALFVGRRSFVKYNPAALYAIAHNATAAQEHGNRWFALTDLPAAAAVAAALKHPTLGGCELEGTPGPLRFVRSATLDGVPTWVIGERKGRVRRTLEISAAEPHLLLRVTGHVSGQPVLTLPSCGGDQSSAARATVQTENAIIRETGVRVNHVTASYSGYNAPQNLRAPRHAPSLPTPGVTQH
jgi:hypothetical protein